MSNWIEHVKAYSKANNVPYKQAMSEARASYNPVEGGKFNLKKVGKTLNKAKKGARKVSKAIDKHGHYLNLIDSDLGDEVNNLNKGFKDISGGKMNFKNVVRKTKNTVKRANKVAKELEPYMELATSGAGVGMRGGGCPHCGSQSGGSFKAIGGKGIQSSLIGPNHPSFNPKPPKSMRKKQIEN